MKVLRAFEFKIGFLFRTDIQNSTGTREFTFKAAVARKFNKTLFFLCNIMLATVV